MNLKQLVEDLKQLSPVTQVVLVIFALVLVLLLATVPTLGTNLIAFLIGLKTLVAA